MEEKSSHQKPTPEWDYWTRLDRWELHDAILLLLELEPRAPNGKEIWSIINEYREAREPLASIVRNAKNFREWALASCSAGKLHISHDSYSTLPREVDPGEWLAWAESKGIAIPEPLRVPSSTPTQPPRSTWPWGDYETVLLRKLAQAVTRFWRLYDPSEPSTAPTNKQVSTWLEDEGVSKRVAEVMAQILRADGLPTGPRK